MSSYNVSPFTRAVVSSMRQLYPESLADKSFDNTGLLVEAPFVPAHPRNRNSVLLTIDLTRAVADEAIENNHSVVVSYHPIIFRGLKAITTDDTQQLSMTLLLAHGISVYCPHTAVDQVPNGMADWLCDVVTGRLDSPEVEAYTAGQSPLTSAPSDTEVTTSESEADLNLNGRAEDGHSDASTKPTSHSDAVSDPFVEPSPTTPKPKDQGKLRRLRPSAAHRTYSKPTYPRPTSNFHPSALSHTRTVVTPSPRDAIDAANQFTASSTYNTSNTGAGRLITFDEAQPLTVLITRIAHAIGLPKGFSVAIPQGQDLEKISIKTVGTCPGSGGSVLRKCNADLLFTGELSHHEALAVTERGGCVISLFHSNSERGYLWGTMREKLEKQVLLEWQKVKEEESNKRDVSSALTEVLNDDDIEVVVSQRDRDPYGIVVLDETLVEGINLGSA
ncbi:uncharacterized protein A1O9_00843 [Exophiala aquamarina CBS 119918]|uniref:YbgI/family dinuclear metal center protein n=1 Tax=Exophiala aquamarina CBS 119918 TaxID=1182545 RepID=A0A072Q4P1_9EURO|nr:uncharacterized protein A1O9_00843 [Exophiala aquamarina CBS 119918]KEF62870.1 hypothetical protein A1O9_00843 [Exophiala aquamarina CBS 119918]